MPIVYKLCYIVKNQGDQSTMNKQQRVWLVNLLVVVALALSACGGPAAAPAQEQAAPAAQEQPAGNQDAAVSTADGGCPTVTVADALGVAAGAFPQQYELAEFQAAADCELAFSENPTIGELNGRITGNPESLPPVAERLPAEPLVIAPYDQIGVYGGVLDGLSNATEAGTSDLLSVRHVNLVRYADDLQTIVPSVAKGWEWNEDFTQLTFFLRQGHKWSDGQPFTAEDISFWYNDLISNRELFPEHPGVWVFGGEPMTVEAVDETTVRFTFPTPAPGVLSFFAVAYIQPFQPKHFLSQFHIDYNPDANTLAEEADLASWTELLNRYFGGSDWKDVPSPLLSGADDQVMPTLESHILVEESTEGRRLVANPFFYMVDTAGQQLPYINEINEIYTPDKEVRNLKITNGEVDYKAQAVFVADFPVYKENEANGNYTVDLVNAAGELVFYGFNLNHKDEGLREIFTDLRFRQAMSLAINRAEIVEAVYLGQATSMQATPADPNTVGFVTDEQKSAFVEYAPDQANALLDEMGLVDTDGDGFRERADGSSLTILLQYSNQGGPVANHELVKSYWEAVGIRTQAKEVTSDEYREQAAANEHDLSTWLLDGTAGSLIVLSSEQLLPEFGEYFNPGNAKLWAEWMRTAGASGIEPPAEVKQLYDLVAQFQQQPLGSEESSRLGKEIVDLHVNNLWKIGLAGDIKTPVIHHNNLGNWGEYRVKTYDYYWSSPYRPFQWFLTE